MNTEREAVSDLTEDELPFQTGEGNAPEETQASETGENPEGDRGRAGLRGRAPRQGARQELPPGVSSEERPGWR